MFMQSLAVQFTGRVPVYHYIMVSRCEQMPVEPGTRVVLPNGIKDGKLSLTIATVVEKSVPGFVHSEAKLPIVQLIDATNLNAVTEIVKAQEVTA
jgi:hypothetical protein